MFINTFAPSNLFTSATNHGPECIAAEVRNHLKYVNLTQDYILIPVVVETSGLIGPDASSLFHEIGRKISRDRIDTRHTSFLFHRLTLAIVRGNAFSIMNSVCLTLHSQIATVNLSSVVFTMTELFILITVHKFCYVQCAMLSKLIFKKPNSASKILGLPIKIYNLVLRTKHI